MYKALKDKLYPLKLWYPALFKYPKDQLPRGDEDYEIYWAEKRGRAVGALSSWQKNRADIIASVIGTDESVSIVDIACGDGSILNYLKSCIKISKAIGTDVSDTVLDQAKKFGIETLKLDINNKEDLKRIPTCDYALMLEILEHIPHSEEILRVVYEKAEKGVFFSFPNTGYLKHRLRILLGRMPMQWRIMPNEHVRFWTYIDLKWWLNAQNYKGYEIFFYKGISGLSRIWPNLFAAAFVVYIPKKSLAKK